jgi:hypothetical protein
VYVTLCVLYIYIYIHINPLISPGFGVSMSDLVPRRTYSNV